MPASDFGLFVLTLAVLLTAVHALGYLAERLKQPRLVGEILAGVLLGPFVLKILAPAVSGRLFEFSPQAGSALGFLYQLGLVLLMFCSGSETRRLFARDDQRRTFVLIGVRVLLCFSLVLGLGFAGLLPLHALTGPVGQESSTLLILAIAVAVTSIPVISRIFWDLRIMHTRFVGLILGAAVIEDVFLWTVLAIATAMAATAAAAHEHLVSAVSRHVANTLIYLTLALLLAPPLLKRLSGARWNVLYQASPVGYLMCVLLAFCAVASALEVNLQFAALLAGYAVIGGIHGSERDRFAVPLDAIAKVSFGVFVPIYFGVVGYKLVFGSEFSLTLLMVFLLGSTVVSILTGALAARLAGFRGLDCVNIALTTNARGGPGIVLASVAYEAGIINATFYTTLVVTAVVTSQMAGVWLRYVLSQGWPLLSSHPEETWARGPVTSPSPGRLAT